MNIDIENNINKIYHYFSIYTVRTEQLKQYCKFANCEYKRFLSHNKACWLSLFPGISRLLEMLSPLDETNGRVCLFQMGDLERDAKLVGCRGLPEISDW